MMPNFVMNASLACPSSLRLQEMILARTMMTLSADRHHCLINAADGITLCAPEEGTSPCYTGMGRWPGQLGPTRGNFLRAAFLSKVGEDIGVYRRI